MNVGPKSESGGHWTAATLLSLGVHGGALAWVLGLLPSFAPPPQATMPETIITVTSILPETGPDATVAPSPDALGATPPEADPAVPARGTTTADPVEPDVAQGTEPPTAPSPEPPSLAPVGPETLIPAAPRTLAPVTAGAAATVTPDAVTPTAPAVEAAPSGDQLSVAISPPAPEGTLDGVLPAAPAVSTPAPPAAAPDPQIEALIARIRGRLDDPCLVALPRARAAPLAPLVQTLADQDVTAAQFADAVLSDPELEVEARTILIDARQCPALTFLRARAAYPAFTLGLDLARNQLASGETLVGRIDGAAGAYTSLMLVDDNGVVQDLRRFLRFTGGRAEFAIPVSRDGPPRETAQLLIAMATPDRPEVLAARAGRLAADIFDDLGQEVGTDARLAVQVIDIR